ncbi:hypothetical protein [Paenirhodobacter populi]|uniref:hypothetical protein n=1 Tax=Paenirhodobacter populi TaxID=2306993 RepID=UPI000FE3D9EF|nr:hypothetical protein [Sinirhodobacter populi]RWR08822.1 hypothetical protein D2T32_08860 [Sinirhodobacter populi]
MAGTPTRLPHMDAVVFGLGWDAGGSKRSNLNHPCRAGGRSGRAAPAAPTDPVMPAFGTILDDARVADYIRSS